jgi:hypothetical protein
MIGYIDFRVAILNFMLFKVQSQTEKAILCWLNT